MATYSAWQQFVQNDAGDVIPSATIEVRDEATGALAILYSTATGTALGNPFTAGIDGLARFYVAAGRYKITATSGTNTATYRFYPIGTAQQYDVGIADGQVITAEEAITRPLDATVSRALTIADRSKHVRFDSGSNLTVTMPEDVFAVNDSGTITRQGSGTLTFQAENSNVIINSKALAVSPQYGVAYWKCVALNEFDVWGDLA